MRMDWLDTRIINRVFLVTLIAKYSLRFVNDENRGEYVKPRSFARTWEVNVANPADVRVAIGMAINYAQLAIDDLERQESTHLEEAVTIRLEDICEVREVRQLNNGEVKFHKPLLFASDGLG